MVSLQLIPIVIMYFWRLFFLAKDESTITRFVVDSLVNYGLGPLLLTWFNFNPSMDK